MILVIRKTRYRHGESPTEYRLRCDCCGHEWTEPESLNWHGEVEGMSCPHCERGCNE